jgi:tRNA pseudouridine55 synthase
LLIVDKPLNITSAHVVARVRHAAGRAKTGHAGTLDPLATGVLICCVGRPATRLSNQLMGLTKTYEATVDLTAFTPSDDAETEPEPVPDAVAPSAERLAAALASLTGEIAQTPSVYSAIKVGGKPAYRRARKGQPVELLPRPVRIYSLEALRFEWPVLDLRVVCGKGTYIRSLARQVGEALGTGGYLTALRRTAVGPYRVEDAVPLAALPRRLSPADLLPLPTFEPDPRDSRGDGPA